MLAITARQAAALLERRPDRDWLLEELPHGALVAYTPAREATAGERQVWYLDSEGRELSPSNLYAEIRDLETARSLEREELELAKPGDVIVLERAGEELYNIVRYRPREATS